VAMFYSTRAKMALDVIWVANILVS